jgi:hypothetical protein
MFLSCLAEFVPQDQEQKILQATRESLEFRELLTEGIAESMQKLSWS